MNEERNRRKVRQGVVVSAMTFLLYKRIERVLFRKKKPVQTPQASNP